MKITATTTVDEIVAQVTSARAELVDGAAAGTTSSKRLLGLAQNIISADSLVEAQLTYLRMVQAGRTDIQRLGYLVDLLAKGADDTWSGRGNDSRRSAQDAVAAWARSEAEAIRYA